MTQQEVALEYERIEIDARSGEGHLYVKAFKGLWLMVPTPDRPGIALTALGNIVVADDWGTFEVLDDLDALEDAGLVGDELLLEARFELAHVTGDETPVVRELDI